MSSNGTAVAWLWITTAVEAVAVSTEDFLLVIFPKDTMEQELVWMIGNFCDIALKIAIAKKRRLSAEHISSVMKSRLQSLKYRAVVQPFIYHL